MFSTKKKTYIDILVQMLINRNTSIGISILLYALFIVHSPLIIYEDAFISFRYAENFAQGFGLSFNSDGIPSEGYSNFLWILILSLSKLANIDILIFARYLGVFFSILTILTLNAVSFNALQRLAWLPSILLVINPIFIHNCSIGLETSMFGYYVILLVFLLQKASSHNLGKIPFSLEIQIGVVLILTSLTRPEGFLFAVTTLIFFWTIEKKVSLQFFKSIWFLIFLITYSMFLLWKYFYFGQILPNTYYCKVAFGFSGIQERLISGLRYAFHFFYFNLFFAFTFACLLILVKSIYKDKFLVLLLLFILTYLFFTISSGGDDPGFFFFRFFYCIIPIFCLLISFLIQKFFEAGKRFKKAIFFSAITIVIFLSQIYKDDYLYKIGKKAFPPVLLKSIFLSMKQPEHFINQFENFFWYFKYNKSNSIEFRTGLWLKEHYSPKTLLAGEQAGQIPYYSGFDFIDTWGLVTTEISRTRLNHEQVLHYLSKKNPDLVVTSDPCRLTGMPAFLNREGFGLRWIIQDSDPSEADAWRGDRMFVFEKGFKKSNKSDVKVKIKGQTFLVNKEDIINTHLFDFKQ